MAGVVRRVLVVLVVGLVFLGVIAPSPAEAQEERATISFVDREPRGQGSYGPPLARVEFSTVTDNGQVGDLVTVADVADTTELDPGCYTVHFNRTIPFYTDTFGVCLAPGEQREVVLGNYNGGTNRPTVLQGFVATSSGDPLEGVQIDIFAGSDPDFPLEDYFRMDSVAAGELRGDYFDTIETDADGKFRTFGYGFPSRAVLTAIAPDGYRFSTGRYINARLVDIEPETLIAYRDDEPAPAEGAIDFPLLDDGPAGQRHWVELVAENGQRRYHAEIRTYARRAYVAPGCYQARRFTARTTDQWIWRSSEIVRETERICVASGEIVSTQPGAIRIVERDATQPFMPGGVATADGTLLGGVQVDFFWPADGVTNEELRDADHSERDYRGDHFLTVETDEQGRYRAPIPTRCLVVTYTAPDGYSFAGSRYLNRTRCQFDDNSFEIAEPEDGGGGPLVGSVVDESGIPVPGVLVDVFRPADGVSDDEVLNGDHSANDFRGSYESTSTTDASGGFTLDPSTNCAVLTYIAPDGYEFPGSGRYLNQGACRGSALPGVVVRGESAESGSVVGSVVGGEVVVDLFVAAADGSRGAWLGDTSSSGGGFTFEGVEPGCYVTVIIAPEGSTLQSTGNRYRQDSFCIAAGQEVALPDAVVTSL